MHQKERKDEELSHNDGCEHQKQMFPLCFAIIGVRGREMDVDSRWWNRESQFPHTCTIIIHRPRESNEGVGFQSQLFLKMAFHRKETQNEKKLAQLRYPSKQKRRNFVHGLKLKRVRNRAFISIEYGMHYPQIKMRMHNKRGECIKQHG